MLRAAEPLASTAPSASVTVEVEEIKTDRSTTRRTETNRSTTPKSASEPGTLLEMSVCAMHTMSTKVLNSIKTIANFDDDSDEPPVPLEPLLEAPTSSAVSCNFANLFCYNVAGPHRPGEFSVDAARWWQACNGIHTDHRLPYTRSLAHTRHHWAWRRSL